MSRKVVRRECGFVASVVRDETAKQMSSIRCMSRKVFKPTILQRYSVSMGLNPLHVAEGLQTVRGVLVPGGLGLNPLHVAEGLQTNDTAVIVQDESQSAACRGRSSDWT